MSGEYSKLLMRISNRYNVSVEQIENRVKSRRTKLPGFVGEAAVARTVAASLAVSAAEKKLVSFLAAGARHVSGLHVTDAVAAARDEAKHGHLATLGYWPHPNETPAVIASHYIEAIDTIADSQLASSISIKVDLLEYDRELLFQVLRQAMTRGVRVHFDAQGFDTVDRTFALLEDGLALGADLSATLPSRWERSLTDAERLVRLGIPIRIVKGQGGDPGKPKIDPRRSLLDLVERISGRASHIGIATHDRRVAEPALNLLVSTKTSCSLEQLRSLPRLDFLAKERGIPTRVYVAYGRFGLPYAIGEIKRRPEVIGWILRDLVVRHRPTSGER